METKEITITEKPVEVAKGITLALKDGKLEVRNEKKNAPVAATT